MAVAEKMKIQKYNHTSVHKQQHKQHKTNAEKVGKHMDRVIQKHGKDKEKT